MKAGATKAVIVQSCLNSSRSDHLSGTNKSQWYVSKQVWNKESRKTACLTLQITVFPYSI